MGGDKDKDVMKPDTGDGGGDAGGGDSGDGGGGDASN